MRLHTLQIEYVYRDSEEEELNDALIKIESSIGGNRRPVGARAGAIDIVSYLDLLIKLVAVASIQLLLEKYFEGLFNAEDVKKLGEKHRRVITEWFFRFERDLSIVLDTIHTSLGLMHTSFTFDGEEKAVVLEIPTYAGGLYVILNHKEISPQLISSLPKGIVKALRYLCENGFSEQTIAFQLYFDKNIDEWVYLLAPTENGFLNFIDRYVDLRSGEIKYLANQSEVIEIFKPHTADTFKFLVSPFYARR